VAPQEPGPAFGELALASELAHRLLPSAHDIAPAKLDRVAEGIALPVS
jgi:hypothetical protein